MKLRAYIAALHAALFAILLAVSPAGSGSMTLLGAGKPAAGGGGGGIVFTPTANPAIQFLNFGSAVASFTSTSIGTASADRILIVGVSNPDSGRTISSVIVDPAGSNVSLTRGRSANGGTVTTGAELWYGNVPTGTSVTIQVTYSGGAPEFSGIQVGMIAGQSGGAGATPSATNGKASNGVADPQTFAAGMTINAGGIGVVYSNTYFAAGAAASWTSTTAGAGDFWATSASGNTMNHALAHTITSGSWNPSVSNMGQFSANALVALAFGP
jgi:hypothetical protein